MILLGLFLVVLLFGAVLLVGAPYLPTLSGQTEKAIKLLDLPKGATIIELGSGDGRVMRRLAQSGYRVVGYELNPILVGVSYLMTWRQRKQVKIIWGDYWRKDWPKADGIYVFLLERFMSKLDIRLADYVKATSSVRVVSYAFKIPGKKPLKTSNALYLYGYR